MLPLDKEVGAGYGVFKVFIPEFQAAVEFHDRVFDWLAQGIATKTLKEYDRDFYRIMKRIAWAQPELWKKVKLRRYAYYFYSVARIWAETVRKEFDDWVPGDGPLIL